MAHLKIIKADEVRPQNIRGLGKEAGQIKRVVATEKFFFNVDEISPGHSPHRGHRHDTDRAEGMEVEYAAEALDDEASEEGPDAEAEAVPARGIRRMNESHYHSKKDRIFVRDHGSTNGTAAAAGAASGAASGRPAAA